MRISLSIADRPAALLEELVQQELLPHARFPTPHVQQIVPSRMPRKRSSSTFVNSYGGPKKLANVGEDDLEISCQSAPPNGAGKPKRSPSA